MRRITLKVRFASAGLWAIFFIAAATSEHFTPRTLIRHRMGMTLRLITPWQPSCVLGLLRCLE